MKRITLLAAIILLPAMAMAQNSAVNKLFNKYKGKDGVTTVQISPELFQMIGAMGIDEVDDCDIPLEQINTIKILTIEDEDAFPDANFYDEIKGDLKTDNFAEVMTVDDGDETVRMWMRADKAVVQEFLLIVGGDDNVLIHMTGNLNMRDLEGIAESLGDVDVDIDM